MSAIAERVAAGAAFLDEHDPNWWRADVNRAIDLGTLDLGAERSCVLGQRCPLEVLSQYAEREWGSAEEAEPDDAYMAYVYALSWATSANEAVLWAERYGFTLSRITRNQELWADLTGEWHRVITERRALVSA